MLELSHADDDDDSHLCIKCNATIIGLENYVKHRKTLCGKKIASPVDLELGNEALDRIKSEESKSISEPAIEPFREERQYNLGADVFFQSLELQSSIKRPPISSAHSIPSGSKCGAGVLTRRATAAMIATTITKDIFSSADAPSDVVSQKRGEDWIGGHNLTVTGTDDNQTKLIKAVENICGTLKKDVITPFNIIDDFKHDDDSNEDSDDSDDMEDDDHQQTGGKWKPSSSHVDNKWKPIFSNADPPSHWGPANALTPEPDHPEDWEEEHTGGKWKPFMSQTVENLSRLEKSHEIDDDEEDAYMPPPGHTKGKWIPGAKDGPKTDHKAQIMDAMALHKEGGSVQYWCGPCNRRLGSKNIYERHLMSNLHMKRTLPEKELEYSGTFKSCRQDSDLGKRIIKPSHLLDETIYLQTKRSLKSAKKETSSLQNVKKKRKRRPTLLNCAVCKFRVKPFLMGKHLISHYHFRKGDTNDDLNKPQILDNIDRIVRQSPFQCSPCKFYVNWQSDFLRHWHSEEHRLVMEKVSGIYWCSFCKFECEDSATIKNHLFGSDHQEVVAAINRSLPIIIRKKSVISCASCCKIFRYNVELKKHVKMYCSNSVQSTASDEYQGRKKCSQCPFVCKSKKGLSRHILQSHGRKMYFCSACCEEFSCSSLARAHRNSQEHRVREREQRRDKGFLVKDMAKTCPHCDKPKFKNIIELKKHLQDAHKDVFTICPQCGMRFTLPQEVTWHIRNKACSFQKPSSSSFTDDHMWTCRICPFVTPSRAECIFHEVLHGGPALNCEEDKPNKLKKYQCPVCRKLFLKPSLRCHLRQHTDERPHVCNVCNVTFSRKSNLLFHIKRNHLSAPSAPEKHPKNNADDSNDAGDAAKSFLCSVCGDGFSKKYNLKQHLTRHTGRAHLCSVPGCAHAARSASELRAHAAAHSDVRAHACSLCPYAAKTKHQLARHVKTHSGGLERKAQCPLCPYRAETPARLQRHLRSHAGVKPYGCPHCAFVCNNLENLRKHVLSRNKHKDKLLYTCAHCSQQDSYSTNFAKDFRVHLTSTHKELHPDLKSTAKYVADFLKIDQADNERSGFNMNGMKFDLISELTVKYEPFQAQDNELKSFSRSSEHCVAMEEFPSEGCYSVTETGSLVPYLGTD